ncbi:MAG: electron transfer flavoprotein subunit beta/FixA family protein [Desulfobacterales bacterium]|nr:electron transfer flavoprotein subunit beta/FixA family protein [Desulfobacterales bacterium]
MLKIVVCIKQVPMVSELPWDSATGSLKRHLAEGMMNPACGHALEAALEIKNRHGGRVTAVTMGPPMAEEVLREACARGADRGVLLTDRAMAGGDTLVTSLTLARAIEKTTPDFDLVLCGCHTSDSETAQVGPQLAMDLDIPGASYIERIELNNRALRVVRTSDDFIETLEMDLPALATISTQHYFPRYTSMAGLQDSFDSADIVTLNADDLGLDRSEIGVRGSPTKILDVYSPTAEKKNIVLKGAARKIVDRLFEQFGDRLSGAMGKDLKTH